MPLTLPKTIAEFKTELELGNVADLDVGTSANNILQLDGSGNLPAVDGRNVTNTGLSNAPYFMSYSNSNNTISDATWTDVNSSTLDMVEEFDSNNAFDASTGRFTPGVLGHYYVTFHAHGDCGGAQLHGGYVRVLKNGTTIHISEIQENTANANEHSLNSACIVHVDNVTDYIHAQVYYNDTSGSPNILGGAAGSSNTNERMTRFFGYRLAL